MIKRYNSIVRTVDAVQFTFDTLKVIYEFLKFADVTYHVKNRTLSGIITNSDGEKLNVNKNDFVVKDSAGKITVWSPLDFTKEFIENTNN